MFRRPIGAMIFGLSLLMQLLAPALASQVPIAGSNSDLVLCTDAASSDTGSADSNGTPSHHEHCGLHRAGSADRPP